ncbi:hypothetical protein ACOBQB_10345 [Streptomyces sp. G5(2025)]|uniref:hypothetical protein n=1 Tax=Streptomyces sp. G5(2025) TaxID=3406628 RepID=UPI003C1AD9D7
MIGRALDDSLCKPCREELHLDSTSAPRAVAVISAPAQPHTATPTPVEETTPRACQGREGDAPCTREALPLRKFCRRHMVQQIAGVVA